MKGYIVCKRCQNQVYQAQEVRGLCRPCAVKVFAEWAEVGNIVLATIAQRAAFTEHLRARIEKLIVEVRP